LSSQLQKYHNKVTEEEIREFFQLIDKDKNNFISTFDLEAYFGSSLDENNHLINAVLSFTNSKENQISFEQLRAFLLS
jgi:Ca2+-binding EF-hand superfamily protein